MARRRYFLLLFLPMTILMVSMIASLYYVDLRSQMRLIEANAVNIVDIQKEIITSDFRDVISDLMVSLSVITICRSSLRGGMVRFQGVSSFLREEDIYPLLYN